MLEEGPDLVEIPSQPSPPTRPGRTSSVCGNCRFGETRFCGTLMGSVSGIQAAQKTVRARYNVVRSGDIKDSVVVICEGWALSYMQLSDGKRQALSILSAGDMVSPMSLLERRQTFSVQAVTDVRYSMLPRRDVKARLQHDFDLVAAWARLVAMQAHKAHQHIADLGRRLAPARIASLILQARRQADEVGDLVGDTFPFPLRQQHIADLIGSTTIHINRLLGTLRKDAVFELSHGVARVLDHPKLLEMAED